MAIGEAATAFVFIFFGIANQLPYILAAVNFILNGLPSNRLSNNVFSLAFAAGLATSSFTGIGNAIMWMAGAEAATNSAIYISLFTFTFLRIISHSFMAVFVERVYMRNAAVSNNQKEFLSLNPYVSMRMGVYVGISWVFHLIEGVLTACVPSTAHLVNYTPFYFYIPGFVLHTALFGIVMYYLVYKPLHVTSKR